jgi:hypothetical protein
MKRAGHGEHMPKLIDLTGRTFGRLRVIERGDTIETGVNGQPIQPRILWWCVCDPGLGGCGTQKQAEGAHLRKGEVVSCGCYVYDLASGVTPLPGRPVSGLVPGGLPIEKLCEQCQTAFTGTPIQKCCSPTCTRAYRSEYERLRRSTES